MFIVGMFDSGLTRWSFVGVFDSEVQAVAACLDWRYFVGPAELNSTTPQAPMPWPGCYYPKNLADNSSP